MIDLMRRRSRNVGVAAMSRLVCRRCRQSGRTVGQSKHADDTLRERCALWSRSRLVGILCLVLRPFVE